VEELEMRLEDGYETREEMMMGQFGQQTFEIGGTDDTINSFSPIDINVDEDEATQIYLVSEKTRKND